MLKIVPPVRFYLFQKVADVRIVSPEEVSLPPIGQHISDSVNGRKPLPKLSQEPTSQAREETSVLGAQDRGEVFLPNLSLRPERERGEESFPLYGSVPDFHLDPARPKAKSGFSLSLGVTKKEPERVANERTLKDLDISSLHAKGLSSLRFNRSVSSENARQIRAMRAGQELISQSVDFDISPWAKEVVDKIRNNWIVPPIEESRARGKVKILIVIEKDGTLSGLDIVEPSGFLLFDESASQAIRSSAPFPPLTGDFPADRLETFLVFEFNE